MAGARARGPVDAAEGIARLVVAHAGRGRGHKRHVALLLRTTRQLTGHVPGRDEIDGLRVDDNGRRRREAHLALKEPEWVAGGNGDVTQRELPSRRALRAERPAAASFWPE